jgi:hypothetical protein
MPGFLGGSSGGSTGSSGVGGEITFPSAFIDPVTKLRVSQPETLIDTDFEYGLQPTKWETVELINNTPSFFSKSGDTTIPNISSILSTEQSREIKVITSLAHGLAVGIPINVAGTKSLTANGSFIINSVPTPTSFTYLCKQNQAQTASIEDLYTSVITGEFFQGSQIRISDSEGIKTDAATISGLTVKTDSPHGFGLNTPFYFLNLNSSISQEFDSSNTTGKSFDASNSSTAQTFDGSNTLNYLPVDFDNKSSTGNITSSIANVDTSQDTITVSHQTGETFVNAVIGTPLYYNVVAGSGYFFDNPRGVVFVKSTGTLSASTATFSVSAVPNGTTIDIVGSITGTFQLANLAKTFAGNNQGLEAPVTIQLGDPKTFDGANTAGLAGTIVNFSGSLVSMNSDSGISDLDWYNGTMVQYTTTGTAATGLTANGTYFVDTFFFNNVPGEYFFTLKNLPGSSGSPITSMSGGTGTQKFKQIGISSDLDIVHVKNNGFVDKQMIKYTYPENGRFSTPGTEAKDFYFVTNKYDNHNFKMNHLLASILPLTASITGEAVTNNIVAGSQQTLNAQGFTGAVSYSISPALPSGLQMSTSTGLISGTPTGAYAITHTITGTDSSGGQAFQTVNINFTAPPPQGQTLYSSPGTYTFTVPARTSTLSAVAIGGGGGGSYVWSRGPGGGGGLAWARDISVTPGETFTVVVGRGGNMWSYWSGDGYGDNSYLQRNSGGQVICRGYGSGRGGPNSNGAASGGFDYTGTGGGGRGGYTNWEWNYSGAGAGGYAGRGGEGTYGYNPGYGGGGAAGTTYSSTWGTPGGGGTGIYGQGADGVGRGSGVGGGGGSGGQNGQNGEPYYSYSRGHIYGGQYGGGAGGSGSQWYGGGNGGVGGVRIIWGPNRFYPATNTQDVTQTS